jgi:hypothetical protein
MRPRHPIQGLDPRPTQHARHISETEQLGALTIALLTLAALFVLLAVVAASR